jgi:hypothetical protein
MQELENRTSIHVLSSPPDQEDLVRNVMEELHPINIRLSRLDFFQHNHLDPVVAKHCRAKLRAHRKDLARAVEDDDGRKDLWRFQ